jgi:TetR/AcrR family transcriptional repressor of nem operon
VHAVIEHQADEIIEGQRPLLDQLDSLAAFEQWRDMLVDLQRQRHCQGGCPLGSLSSELAETGEFARTALAAGFERWEAPIRDGLRRMRDRGELVEETDVDQLALGTLAALQGGLLLTQAKRNVGPLEAALDLAISQIRQNLET